MRAVRAAVAAAVVIGTAPATWPRRRPRPGGPPLDVPAASLERSLDCTADAFTSGAADISTLDVCPVHLAEHLRPSRR